MKKLLICAFVLGLVMPCFSGTTIRQAELSRKDGVRIRALTCTQNYHIEKAKSITRTLKGSLIVYCTLLSTVIFVLFIAVIWASFNLDFVRWSLWKPFDNTLYLSDIKRIAPCGIERFKNNFGGSMELNRNSVERVRDKFLGDVHFILRKIANLPNNRFGSRMRMLATSYKMIFNSIENKERIQNIVNTVNMLETKISKMANTIEKHKEMDKYKETKRMESIPTTHCEKPVKYAYDKSFDVPADGCSLNRYHEFYKTDNGNFACRSCGAVLKDGMTAITLHGDVTEPGVLVVNEHGWRYTGRPDSYNGFRSWDQVVYHIEVNDPDMLTLVLQQLYAEIFIEE